VDTAMAAVVPLETAQQVLNLLLHNKDEQCCDRIIISKYKETSINWQQQHQQQYWQQHSKW